MRKISILVLFLGTILSFHSASAAHPHNNGNNQKDSIEWVALWSFPKTREQQLERMLTTELQRRILWALQEKRYLKPGKEYVYWFDPFQVTDMRQADGGFSELDVIASIHKVINNKVDKKTEKYQITFRANYELGFVVINVSKL